jgi:hypothetical protein
MIMVVNEPPSRTRRAPAIGPPSNDLVIERYINQDGFKNVYDGRSIKIKRDDGHQK